MFFCLSLVPHSLTLNQLSSKEHCRELIAKLWTASNIDLQEYTNAAALAKDQAKVVSQYNKSAAGPCKEEQLRLFLAGKNDTMLRKLFEQSTTVHAALTAEKKEREKERKRAEVSELAVVVRCMGDGRWALCVCLPGAGQ
jgi:hypothetical protein